MKQLSGIKMKKRSSGAMLYDLLTTFDEFLDDAINLDLMYGVFLLKSNHFMICKEKNLYISEYSKLREFFTGELVAHGLQKKEKCPWRQCGKFTLNATKNLETGFSISITKLLSKFSLLTKIENEKDLAYLYLNVNKYIKENPNFIDELIENEKNKMI